MNRASSTLLWIAVALLGAFAFGTIALAHGERVSALWIVIAAVCVYLIAYRFYSRFIASKVMQLDGLRMTPAVKYNDGLDYVPTNKYVLFGHHFAAIAGAGPLVGPCSPRRWATRPACCGSWPASCSPARCRTSSCCSSRRAATAARSAISSRWAGTVPGVIALFGAFLIMVIILAVLALIVVKALTNSPWGTFTVAATIPIALFMGVYARHPSGRIGEVSIIGFVLLMASIAFGQHVHDSPTLAAWFTFTGTQLTWILIGYGFVASVLPVWLLLRRATTCPPS